MDAHTLWQGLAWPLIRLCLFISIGLFIANLIESLNWTHLMARLAAPLIRVARLKDVSGASFSMAFFSSVAANTMLAEAHDKGELNKRELILSNLFNSMPTYFLHLPTMFFLTLPFLGAHAFVYVGLTLGSAFLRTALIIGLGRLILPPLPEGCVVCRLDEDRARGWREALNKTWRRFKKRIRRVLFFTAPIYTLVYFMNHFGLFAALEQYMAENLKMLSFLPPRAMSVVALHVAAEFSAALAAAGAMLESGAMSASQTILALLTGNVLSSPMRAIRHQIPFYMGIFPPATATHLIIASQSLRALSVMAVGAGYWLLA